MTFNILQIMLSYSKLDFSKGVTSKDFADESFLMIVELVILEQISINQNISILSSNVLSVVQCEIVIFFMICIEYDW